GGSMRIRPDRGPVDGRAGALGVSNVMSFKGKEFGMLAPIILDLDGDGIEMKSAKKSKARFDMNGDGASDDTGWVGAGDGFLVIDRNRDGRITHMSELSFGAEDADAASDLEALAMLDNNGDRVIDARDVRFGELKVWVDADLDGVSDAGELKTLAELGIKSIGLAAQHREGTAKVDSNILLSTAIFTRENGATGTLGNAALAYRPGARPTTAARDVAALLAAMRDRGEPTLSFDHLQSDLPGAQTRPQLFHDLPASFEESGANGNVEDQPVELAASRAGGGATAGDPSTDAPTADDLVAGLRRNVRDADRIDGLSWRQLDLDPVLEAAPAPMPIDDRARAGADAGGVTAAPGVDDRLGRVLASMVQDMGVFGARDGAAADRIGRPSDVSRPVDYFA
ncbi:MAG TPA: hypothetical protein VJM13_01650, partial [Sphingopyxis sp.]|nr:hypothetical protein [Sphingopyxis sp.]